MNRSFIILSYVDGRYVGCNKFRYFRGRQDEIVVNELSKADKNLIHLFLLKSPYSMSSHCSGENGLNWEDGHIAYHDLYMLVSEAVAGFAHLYCMALRNANFSPNC